MSEPSQTLSLILLAKTLAEKRNLYNQMLRENKEFEEVKILFIEIRELERSIQG